jgi:YcaO-like protein with predicted kinase domain
VEVACAVRPLGHVLQVSNGKGLGWEEAAHGAVLEAAELFAAERVDPACLRWGSFEALASEASGGLVLEASALGSGGALREAALAGPRVRMAWRRGTELFSGRPAWVPAQAIHCPQQSDLGPVAVAWTTNGMGAHADPDAALLHALLEAAERDQLARAAPEGLDPSLLLSRRLSNAELQRALPDSHRLARQLEAAGFDVALLDLAPEPTREGALGLAVAGALLLDREGGPVPLTAGYGCRLRRDDAFLAALLEAAQSRLTDIHGAREDVAAGARDEALALGNLLRSAGAQRRASQLPRDLPAPTPKEGLRRILGRMAGAGVDVAVAVDVADGALPVHVVKVVVPRFQLSELLL